uniref:Uncharacterized protein n=1 Tax=Nymphaea colorata TaxID=210225 RepID=A0A5K0ZFI3_9MAGN
MEDSRHHPIAGCGCVAAILKWIKVAIEKAIRSPWPFDPAVVPPIPDPPEVLEPSSPLSPIPNEPHDFDIFLSFRGEDT